MIRTQVSLGEREYRDAKAEAARQGISLAEFLRRAVGAALLERRSSRRPWMRHAGSLASGDPQASVSVDEVVYGRGRP
ncbi:MAG: CopG family transcriptional regulator [Acidobacteria bacterium]|nr:CopG family transcriptional regulator [Acidobacteriota bacterium]